MAITTGAVTGLIDRLDRLDRLDRAGWVRRTAALHRRAPPPRDDERR